MAAYKEISKEKVYMGSADYDSDLWLELSKVCEENNIACGEVTAIGSYNFV